MCIRRIVATSKIPEHEFIELIKFVVDTYLKVETVLIIFIIIIAIFDMLIFYKKSKLGILKWYGTILYHLLIVNIIMGIMGNGDLNFGIVLDYFNILLLLLMVDIKNDNLKAIFSRCKTPKNREKELLAGDTPIKDAKYLFPERKIELENIINQIYNYTSDEPYVISIVGKWGKEK